MIMGMALMEGRGVDGVRVDMENQYAEALIKNCKSTTSSLVVLVVVVAYVLSFFSGELWIPATVVNIAFVKPDLRVLYDNLVFFFWTIFLSMLLNQPMEDP